MSPARLANDFADQALSFHSQFTRDDLLKSKEAVKTAVRTYTTEVSSLVRDCVVARPDLSGVLFETAKVRRSSRCMSRFTHDRY